LLPQVTEEVDKVHKTKSTQFTIPVKESVTHCCQDIVFSFINLVVRLYNCFVGCWRDLVSLCSKNV